MSKVEVLHDYVVRLDFEDGFTRVMDLEPVLDGPVFEPLRDLRLFRQVSVDPVMRTIVWPNGADLAPEFLYGEENISRLKWPEARAGARARPGSGRSGRRSPPMI